MKQILHRLDYRLSMTRVLQIAAVGLLLAASAAQMLGLRGAEAAQLTSRKVTISDSEISQTGVEYDFAFTLPTAAAVQGIIIEFCTTPLGDVGVPAECTAPGGFTAAAMTVDGQSFSEANAFADGGSTDEHDCDESGRAANVVCLERVDTDAETAAAKTLDLGGITNANTQSTVYARIYIYDDVDFEPADLTDNGVVAAATARQLTVNGRVQERLEFCVSALVDDVALPADCTAMGSNTTIDLGVIDNTAVYWSPVDTTATNGSNDSYGLAMINTNGTNGTTLSYFADQAATGTFELRAFRVTGATCANGGADSTDQCFESADTTVSGIAAGTEEFGMVVPCIAAQGTTTNLTGTADYNGDDNSTAHAADCENEAETTVAWNDTATASNIATASSVVHNEVVKLNFGVTASATTPTGSYTVQSTYIATPTF